MSSVPSTSEAMTATACGGTVLVVEDETFNRFLLRRLMADLGCIIAECTDGASALAAARERAPDVALVDVGLPDIDGFTLCRQLKANPATADIPVIMVTARSDIADIERGFEAGALDYIRKPYHPRELVARVRNAIELKRRGDSLRKWKDRTSRELALAGALQRTLLSTRPFLHERLRIHPAYYPSTEVGGDFFDIVPLPEGRIAVYVGDVSGHGIGPAMVATLLKASLAEFLPVYAAQGPARVCNELHARFLQQIDLPSMFATLFLAIIDLETRRWHCISCGHPAPIVASVSQLKRSDIDRRGGPPVGLSILPGKPFSADDEITVDIPPDAVLLFVTDGLLEAIPSETDEAGGRRIVAEQLDAWVRGGRTCETAVEFVFRRMAEMGYGLENDDCTALSCAFVPPEEVVFAESVRLSHEALHKLATGIEHTLKQAAWTEEAAWAVALLVLEHGANVIRHGKVPADARFSVQVRLFDGACELLIRDEGAPWNYTEPASLPDDSWESGRGVFIIRRIATRIEACRAGGENVTVFTIARDWRSTP